MDIFYSVRAAIRIDSSAEIRPCKIDVQFYKSEFAEIPLTQFLAAMLALRFIAMFYTIWLVFLKIKFRKVLPDAKFGIATDLIQALLSFIPIIMSIQTIFSKKYSVKNILDPNSEDVDLLYCAQQQQLRNYIDGLCVQFLSFKLIQNLRINRSIDWLFIATGKTFQSLFFFYVITLPVLMGFGFCYYYMFGTKNEEVSTLPSMVYTIYRNV